MKGAYHHLRRIDQVVMQSGTLTRPESACPMRFLQLTSKTRLITGAGEGEEAILKMTRENGTVLHVLDRLALGVQQPLYSLDDFIAMGQEQLEKFDMRVKRHLHHNTLPTNNRWLIICEHVPGRRNAPDIFVTKDCTSVEKASLSKRIVACRIEGAIEA